MCRRSRGRFAGLKLGQARAAEAGLEPAPGRFEGLKLRSGPSAEPAALETPTLPQMGRDGAGYLDWAVERFERAYADAARMGPQGYAVLEHQKAALREAGRALDGFRPHGTADLHEAFRREPSLVGAAREGRVEPLKAALEREAKVRASPDLRAERFVTDWTALKTEHARLGRGWDQAQLRKALEARMGELAAGLKRYPQLESLLRSRDRELGLGLSAERSQSVDLGQALVRSVISQVETAAGRF